MASSRCAKRVSLRPPQRSILAGALDASSDYLDGINEGYSHRYLVSTALPQPRNADNAGGLALRAFLGIFHGHLIERECRIALAFPFTVSYLLNPETI
jgi:hypothetical protein